ncbi:MAG: type II secretion system protein [Deltaproteobacteria bacterium]|nr:type II secretion system protein [Deltaproteobacteria bacterium]
MYRKKNGEKNMSKIRNSEGFTLMELMIVLVIMGFLIAMLAPRLGGLMGDAIDTVCDTNNKGIREFVREWQLNQGSGSEERLPDRLVTMVNANTADPDVLPGGIVMPEVDNRIPSDGAETLCHEFVYRNKPYLHILTADEADELINMGISQLMVLNDADGSDAQGFTGTPMELHNVMNGLGVLMVGAGDTDGNGTWEVPNDCDMAANYAAYEADVANMTGLVAAPSGLNGDHGNPYWMYRILAGVGPDCQLVTEGIVMNAAGCPGGLQNSDNVTYNLYCMVLPRLEATVGFDQDGNSVGGSLTGSGLPAVIDVKATDTGEEKTWDFRSAEPAYMFEATCPEGHKWPDNETEMWSITAAPTLF